MRKCLIVLFLVSSFWSAAYSATAANETGQQTPPGEPSETICQMSDAARDAINSATAVVVKKEGTAEALELIYQAKKAARPPECDSAKAKMLADKAKRAPSETDPKIVEAIYTSPL